MNEKTEERGTENQERERLYSLQQKCLKSTVPIAYKVQFLIIAYLWVYRDNISPFRKCYYV
jgi:hypothetical protein